MLLLDYTFGFLKENKTRYFSYFGEHNIVSDFVSGKSIYPKNVSNLFYFQLLKIINPGFLLELSYDATITRFTSM